MVAQRAVPVNADSVARQLPFLPSHPCDGSSPSQSPNREAALSAQIAAAGIAGIERQSGHDKALANARWVSQWRPTMTSTLRLAASIILSVATATPALAQRMIEEPGAFAFVHPMGDLGIGSARPATDAMASVPLRDTSGMAGLRMQASRPLAARHVKGQ
jgi:hypothetical protein